MPQRTRNVLVVGGDATESSLIESLLGRSEFDVDRFPRAGDAIYLLDRVPFELLVVRFPLQGISLSAFLDSVRRPGGPCRQAAIVLLASDDDLPVVSTFVGCGVNRVVSLDDPSQVREEILGSCLDVAPRKAARLTVRLEVELKGLKERLYCETENLSTSGMLITTDQFITPGTTFDFNLKLPYDQRLLGGMGEVVRQAGVGREDARGLGVRFLSLSGDSQKRLERFLQSRLVPAAAAV